MNPQEPSEQVRAAIIAGLEASEIVESNETWTQIADNILHHLKPFLAPPVTQPAANGEKAVEAAEELYSTPFGDDKREVIKLWASIIQRICFPATATATEQEEGIVASCGLAEARYWREMMEWLHDSSSGQTDPEGYEWGIYRVKWENGNAVSVMQTLSDFSDLRAEMVREKDAKVLARFAATPPVSGKDKEGES